MTGVLVRRDTGKDSHTTIEAEIPVMLSISQGSVKIADKNQKLQEVRKNSPLQFFRESVTQLVP